MRKKLLVIILIGAVLLMSACGSPQESDLTEDAAPTVNDGEAIETAYYSILRGICNDHVYPDGTDCGYFEASDPSANQYAIYDIDGDGADELIVVYTSTISMAGMVEKIYRYDTETGETTEVLSEFPLLTFYDNGIIQADRSHNQGPAGDSLWPYTLWQYDAGTDGYTAVGMADAWDESMTGEYDGKPFPAEADQDGDGVVYYIMEYGNYDLSAPVDKAQYEQWRDSYLGGAAKVTLPFEDLTAENVA